MAEPSRIGKFAELALLALHSRRDLRRKPRAIKNLNAQLRLSRPLQRTAVRALAAISSLPGAAHPSFFGGPLRRIHNRGFASARRTPTGMDWAGII